MSDTGLAQVGGSGGWKLFGFQIQRAKEPEVTSKTVQGPQERSFAIPQSDDGAVTIQTGAYFGTYVDLEGIVRNEVELITRYREMSMQAELESAIDDIINEAIVVQDHGSPVKIVTDDIPKLDDAVKDRIAVEFENCLQLLDFSNMGHDIFRRWYVDGRIFYHVIIDEKNPGNGIKELRYIDPRRIRKVREIQKTKDPKTGIDIISNIREYYLYNERGVIGAQSNLGVRISTDSVVNVNSGLLDSRRAMVLSYLHKAIKPLNQLRMVEDATVIYRLSRAPDRRVFYIDVGNLAKTKAEQYLKDIMTKYRNKIVYDANTGEVKDDRKHLAMIEDYWLPRREGTRGTEIQTLPGGENLGKMEDVEYFQKKLYNALGIPISRLLAPEQGGFSLGRTTEITRDEIKFNKFILRLRNKFSTLFDDLLRIQLVLKGVCTEEEWDEFREKIWYDYIKDNNFNELKEVDLLTTRMQLMNMVDPYVGRFYSASWARKNILQQSDEEIKEQDKQIEKEADTVAAQSVFQQQQDQMEQQAQMQKDQMKMQKDQMKLDAQPPQDPEPTPFGNGKTFDPVNRPLDDKISGLRLESVDTINSGSKKVLKTIKTRRKSV